MADILIRGILKPTDCGKCFVGDRTICADGCPLHELPEHGDLIDLDERVTKQVYDDYHMEWNMKTKTIRQWLNVDVNEMTVIVPSNKEETE